MQISRAEDELRYDAVLENLLKNADAHIRTRAALAAGRIGDEKAITALTNLLENDKDETVQTMAAFAIGEIESIKGADAILKVLKNTQTSSETRARAVEAAGKIAAANAKDEKSKMLGEAILNALNFENTKRSGPFDDVIELGLTAVLRARPAEAEKTLVRFLDAYTPKIRADALNALTRLRAKNANEQARKLLTNRRGRNRPRKRRQSSRRGGRQRFFRFAFKLRYFTDKDSRVESQRFAPSEI